jgi:prophage regulatory protein
MRILRAQAARDKTGDSRSDQYDKINRGLYPRQVHLGDKAVGWVEEELEALNRARVAARDLGLRGEARDDFIRKALAKIAERDSKAA